MIKYGAFPFVGTHSASKGHHIAVHFLLLHFHKRRKKEKDKIDKNSNLSNA